MMKHNIFKESLHMLICTKLLSEGYFYAKGCTEGMTIKRINSLLKNKKVDKNVENKDLQLGNDETTLIEICSKINCVENHDMAKAIVTLYLNQTYSMDVKKSLISKENYAQSIFDECCDYKLIDRKKYVCKEGFILEKEIILKKITSLSDYVTTISALNNDSDQELFFRGHSNINYNIKPSVFRDNFYKKEFIMFQQLVVSCQEYFIKCRSHFEFISLMQHYGLPTRLLDITFNPLVALYFACEKSESVGELLVFCIQKDNLKYERSDTVTILSCLPMFKYSEQQELYEHKNDCENCREQTEIIERFMHEIKIEKPAFLPRIKGNSITEPIFIVPSRNNKRIINQKGAFILFGLDENLMKQDSNTSKSSLYPYKQKTVYYIPLNTKKKLLDELM